MKFRVLNSFLKDLKKVKDKNVLKRVERKIATIKGVIENTEEESALQQIPNLRKLTGYENAYRIKVGRDYRIGATKDEIEVIIEEAAEDDQDDEIEKEVFFSLRRFLHRKDIYRKFPKS